MLIATPARTPRAPSVALRAPQTPPLRCAAPKPLPALEKFVGKSYESKLPGINQGAKYEPNADKSEEKPLFERLIFTGTWVRRSLIPTVIPTVAAPGRPCVVAAIASPVAPLRGPWSVLT